MLREVVRESAIWLQKRVPSLFPSHFCLVTGIPRAGTGAMADWLGEQPLVKSFSETKFLRISKQLLSAISSWKRFSENEQALLARRFAVQCYASQGVYLGSRLLVDKEPLPPEGREQFISVAETLFPSARIIVMIRSPEAVVNSMRQRKWGYTVDGMEPQQWAVQRCIEAWNQRARFTTQIASRENTTVIQFEDLVSEPAKESSRVREFLGLSRGENFAPRPTSEITLAAEECRKVWSSTKQARQMLEEHGIVYGKETYSRRL